MMIKNIDEINVSKNVNERVCILKKKMFFYQHYDAFDLVEQV